MDADRLAKLKLLEAVTFDSINEAPADKRAPLVGQMRGILAEIAELEANTLKAGDPVDEIAARRSARGAVSAPVQRRAPSN